MDPTRRERASIERVLPFIAIVVVLSLSLSLASIPLDDFENRFRILDRDRFRGNSDGEGDSRDWEIIDRGFFFFHRRGNVAN